ncbi:hypothetical protein L596_029080 [Steinernema carpocapsae]|uniref:AB hydrolase-1 domain-containing protein n=1 Tax=Steinernema carpocapsae TaxID=34508 RepID=A0A4U5LTK6_STECR|nr:hypothetical protein L596_029080 [Steinernema carpocapsae]
MSVEHMDFDHRHAPHLSCSHTNHQSKNLFRLFFNLISWGIVLYVEFLYYFVKIVTFPFAYICSMFFGLFGGYLKLPQPSKEALDRAENELLSEAAKTTKIDHFTTEVLQRRSFLHSIRCDGNKSKTYSEEKIPLVLLHELGGGVGCWARNLGELANDRPTYALDLLGFGKSGRFDTSPCATLTELDYVTSIEEWRREMGIEKMILVGHSFGGFIAASYSLEHPSKVRHLILVEPWGFEEEPHVYENLIQVPIWMKGVAFLLSMFLPLFFVRIVGPLAPKVFRMFSTNLMRNFAPWRPAAFSHYFYQCNAQDPSGERSFRTISHFCWPKRPMIQRFVNVSSKLPVTFILGSRSNYNREVVKEIQEKRPESYTYVQEIWCGSRPHCERPEEFNNDVLCVAQVVDRGTDVLQPENF